MIRSPIAALVCAIALCACSHPQAEQATTTTAPAYAAMARGVVDVQGGLIRIAAPREGVLANIAVAPGDEVKAGALLAMLDAHAAQLALAAARAELDQAKAHSVALQSRVVSAAQRADRARQAAQAGAASGQSADDAAQALAGLNAEIGEATAATEAASAHVAQAEHEVQLRTLRAPASARVVARNAHAGDVVSPQNPVPLFTLLPDAPRIVRAELNEAFVNKVAVGMHAEIVADVGDGKVYTATVTRIGEVFGPSKLVEDTQEVSDTRDVECILKLDDQTLRVGQRVQVRFKAR